MDNRARMDAGLVYDPADPSLRSAQDEALELLHDYNATRPSQAAERAALLVRMLGAVGERCWITPPFHANWGGANVFLGSDVYANVNLTLVDDGPIHIGDHVMFGPNVVVTTAGHPVLPELRVRSAQFNLGVRIGDNVWIGSGVQVMPGVTIGDDSVIGAGSVVTRDVPAGVVALGVPCRVVREIGEHDRTCYWRDREYDLGVDELLASFVRRRVPSRGNPSRPGPDEVAAHPPVDRPPPQGCGRSTTGARWTRRSWSAELSSSRRSSRSDPGGRLVGVRHAAPRADRRVGTGHGPRGRDVGTTSTVTGVRRPWSS